MPQRGLDCGAVSKIAIPLETLELDGYSDLYAMPTAEALRKLDEKAAPLHEGDAFLGVLVLRAVKELETPPNALRRRLRALRRLPSAWYG
jgi:hypothetical protein